MTDTGPVPRFPPRPEAGSSGHGVGRAEADGWSAATASDAAGYLVFGPYATDIPAGNYDAFFRLMVDNRDANNDIVVTLDVNDYDGGSGMCGVCSLAGRDVRRMEFTGTFAYQDFVVRFTNPGAGHRIELRTYWTDRSYVRQDRVTVQRVP